MPKRYIQTTEDILYRYEELDESGKDEAFDTWQKDRWEDYDGTQWEAEHVIDDAKEIGKRLGIDISEVYWSGFSSQGDGACFEGSYSYKKGWRKLIAEYMGNRTADNKEVYEMGEALQRIQKKYFYQIYSTVKHSGHYYHEYCTNISHSTPSRVELWGDEQALQLVDDQIMDACLRDFMRWIYKRLEEAEEWRCGKELFLSDYKDEMYFNEDGTEMFEGVMDKELGDYVEEDEAE